MKKLTLFLLFLPVIALTQPPRQKLLFDFGWKFALGHAADPQRDFGYGIGAAFAKAGEAQGAAHPNFSDSLWRSVDLPHDWAVELPFVNHEDPEVKSHGYKPVGRLFPESSVGWYRRAFAIPAADRGRRIRVEFDGVFRDAAVWCNGHYLGRHAGGYTPFSFDLTDYLRYGQRNTLVVRVDASHYEGWFYEGAGIYRHVWLHKYEPLHLAEYGVYVHSQISGAAAEVTIETIVENLSPAAAEGRVCVDLLDRDRRLAGRSVLPFAALQPLEATTIRHAITVADPRLWSLEDPHLYTVHTVIEQEGRTIDSLDTPVGLRSLRFDPDRGFFLNGAPVKIQGVCCHQDHGGVGSALPDALQEYRIRLLKAMGCNAYRTSHNPPTPELLDACDRLGMLVMDEHRLMGSSPEILNELETLVRRDRNHPSVILWSIGNEEYVIQGNETGAAIASTMMARLRRLDPGRTITYGANIGPDAGGINTVIPVRGFNYKRVGAIDRYRSLRPDQPLIGSEEGSTVCTRGFYANDTLKGYVCDYDSMYPPWATTAQDWWSFYADRPWLSGGFVWTGFDYRGEPTPYSWPCINSHFGIMDMCGFPKNNYFYYQAWWSGKDVLHLFPHWNWPGREGEEIEVWVHSNCDSVELFLNGRSLGRMSMPRNGHLAWRVPYESGRLEAAGWRSGRRLAAAVETTGPAKGIHLAPDKSSIRADQEDLCMVTVTARDGAGREMAVADQLIHFELQGPGRIIGVANGDPSSHEADKCADGSWQRRLFSGKCQVIIQALRKSGEILLTASAPGLLAHTVAIRAESCTPRPLVPPYQPDQLRHLGLGMPVHYGKSFSYKWPGAGAKTLSNGLLGSSEYNDGQWQGFEGEDLEAVIDLGAVQKIGSLCATFLQDAGSWIFWPKTVSFALSRDGRSFTPAGGVTACEDVRSSMIKAFRVEAGGKRARYVRVTGVSVKVCPPDHRAAGSPAWLFVDEVVIE